MPLFLMVFQAISIVAFAAVDELPIAPLNPQTMQDCHNLRSKYMEMIMEKHREMRLCMQSELTIGQGRLCNGGYGKQAWPECGDIEFSRCEIERSKDKEYQLCRNAVNAKKQKEKETKDTLYEKGKKLGKAATEAVNAYRDPEGYLKDIAHDQLHKILIGNEAQGFSKDETIAHIYQYGYNFAKSGIKYTNDPVIRDFQNHLLEKIGNAHKSTLLKIDHIDSEMGGFIEELRAANRSSLPTSSTFKPSPIKPSGGDSHQDCFLRKSSCEQSCGGAAACMEACGEEWYRCRYE